MGDENQQDYNQDTGMTYDEKIERKFKELDDIALEYSKYEAARGYLENFRHSKLAILMKQSFAIDPKLCTAAAQEREARAHPEYIELLKGLQEATQKAEEYKWKLKNAHLRGSLHQTRQANKRAQMTMR